MDSWLFLAPLFLVSSNAMEGLHLFHEMPKSTARNPLGASFQTLDAKTKEASVATTEKIPKYVYSTVGPFRRLLPFFFVLDSTLNGG